MELKEKVKSLKREIVQKLSGQDLVGKPIFVRDLINFPQTLVVLGQDGTRIEVEDEMSDVRTVDLGEFGIETLLDLIE